LSRSSEIVPPAAVRSGREGAAKAVEERKEGPRRGGVG
jgi:hypothetical protein